MGTKLGERARRREHGGGGFASVELLISLAILMVAVLSAFGSQLATLRLVDTSRQTQIALDDLRACMERILSLPAADLPIPGSDYEHGRPIAAFVDLHLDDERLVATYPGWTAGSEVLDPQPVVLTLTWSDELGRERSLALRSLVAR